MPLQQTLRRAGQKTYQNSPFNWEQQLGEFTPWMQQYDPTALKQLLESQRSGALTDIYERAASKGTYYGAGGTMPGELQLAQQEQGLLAQDYMRWQQAQQEAVARQYLAYIGQKYGMQSKEYEMAWQKYFNKEAEPSGWSALGKIAGTVGGGIGGWFLGGGNPATALEGAKLGSGLFG